MTKRRKQADLENQGEEKVFRMVKIANPYYFFGIFSICGVLILIGVALLFPIVQGSAQGWQRIFFFIMSPFFVFLSLIFAYVMRRFLSIIEITEKGVSIKSFLQRKKSIPKTKIKEVGIGYVAYIKVLYFSTRSLSSYRRQNMFEYEKAFPLIQMVYSRKARKFIENNGFTVVE